MQNSLFAPRTTEARMTKARSTDPFTSREAGRGIAGGVSRLQRLVLDYVIAHRGCTDKDMVDALRATHGGSESTYRTRRKELLDLGLVAPLGIAEVDGRKHSTWTATADALR